MLAALIDGRALPAGELAFIGNVAPATASFHLNRLLDAQLLSVERQGKHKYYRLASEAVASALESIAALAPLRDHANQLTERRSASERVKELRFARTCYKHLAGRLAVDIHHALFKQRLLIALPEKEYRLTQTGERWWLQLGADLPPKFRGRGCLDWTERRPHLAGPLGVLLFARLKELGWLATIPHTRAVRVTHAGQRALQSRLGLTIAFK
jgi:DNA-binding transcriptional ArsR family regulator